MELADIIRERLREAEGRVAGLREQLTEAEQEAQSWRLVLPLEIQRKERRGSLLVTVPLVVDDPTINGHIEVAALDGTFEDRVVEALKQVDDVVTAPSLSEIIGSDSYTVSGALSHLYKKGRVDRVALERTRRGPKYAYLAKGV